MADGSRAAASILPLRASAASYAVGGAALVQGLTFTLAAGPRTVILGANGAGKSVTLRLCHGLLQPSAGTIEWLGPAAGMRRGHAMVFQRPLMLRRSVLANVTHALRLAGAKRTDAKAAAAAALARFGLAPLARRQARVLSGGEQQRLAIARAWAIGPELLFLDEPTASLDPAATRAVEEMIAALHADGVKIVMSTHDLGQARRMADEVIFLHRGRLLEHGPAGEFFDRPRTAEAAAFIRGELLW
jgi:tungstate transport system ATP-binding protein